MAAERRRPSLAELAELTGHPPGQVIGALWELAEAAHSGREPGPNSETPSCPGWRLHPLYGREHGHPTRPT
jgi:hypothetical protein